MKSRYNGYSFPLQDTVTREKVRFHNRYGIQLAGDLYLPKGASGKLAAVAVSGPFGAVKEQCSGLYAEELASRGFAALAFDPSFTGESGGEVRNVASPDINTEDFSAAVDYLSTRDFVDPEKVGILGICGWGGMALNAAAMDTRIKATVTSTMYDMTRVNAKGYFDSADSADARYETKKALNAQRTEDYKAGTYARAGGVVDPLPEDAPFFVKDYYDYYKTGAGLYRALPQLQRRLEHHLLPVLSQHAHSPLQQRDPQCCAGHPRREGPLLLLQPGRLCRHGQRQSLHRQQGAAHSPRSRPHRPL